jgi:hypothetical protein
MFKLRLPIVYKMDCFNNCHYGGDIKTGDYYTYLITTFWYRVQVSYNVFVGNYDAVDWKLNNETHDRNPYRVVPDNKSTSTKVE